MSDSKYLEVDDLTRVRISKLVVRGVGRDGCWGWKGATHPKGYSIHRARVGGNSTTLLVHRLMVEERARRSVGRLANQCGRRWCVNPEHWKPEPPERALERARSARKNGAHGGRHHSARR